MIELDEKMKRGVKTAKRKLDAKSVSRIEARQRFSLLGRELERGVDPSFCNRKSTPLSRISNAHKSSQRTATSSLGEAVSQDDDNILTEIDHTSMPLGIFASKLVSLKRAAFTLAEVLITLGIIGVVAALTLPTLIQNYKKQVYANSAKKSLNTVMNLMNKIQAEEDASNLVSTTLFSDGLCNTGGSCEEPYGNPMIIKSLIPKYVKTVKICRNNECNIEYTWASMSDNKLVLENSTNKLIYSRFGVTIYGFYLTDGTVLYIFPNEMGISVYFDTNGEKGPNIEGYDLFLISFSKKTGKANYNWVPVGEPDNEDYYDKSPLYHLIQNDWKMDY